MTRVIPIDGKATGPACAAADRYTCVCRRFALLPPPPAIDEKARGAVCLSLVSTTFDLGRDRLFDPELGDIFVLGLSLFLPFFVLSV